MLILFNSFFILLAKTLSGSFKFSLTISTLLFAHSIRTHTEQKLAKDDLPTALNEVKNGIELALSIRPCQYV